MHVRARVLLSLFLFLLTQQRSGSFAQTSDETLETGMQAANQARHGFRVADGFRVEAVAAEPLLANPVAFCFDDAGRILVCETFRLNRGTEDNRRHMYWLDDDLAAQRVEDRQAYIQKHHADSLDHYRQHQDRLRMLQDCDRDGVFEKSTLFADGFNEIVDGIGSGVTTRGREVFYGCIPNLWRLQDDNDDGVSDSRKSLHRGFGVRFAFIGHDLHGLCWGPDGKLYFSVGDRGLHIETEGRTIAMPDRGAVLRCNGDGTELEVVHSGLRNPQELAFDKYGNLFTGDNNSDYGDAARWVHVVEGADSGWRMHYQYLPDRGPWGRERLWQLRFAGQAAYILPPLKHLPSGPAGLTYDPGVGLPSNLAGCFFLADFHASPNGSGVNAIRVELAGAGFRVTGIDPLIQNVLATDVDFGPDGSLYVLDWIEGWDGLDKGRIYRLRQSDAAGNSERISTHQLLVSDLRSHSNDDLAALLEHHDMRVRLRVQFAMVSAGESAIDGFRKALAASESQLARIHSIWGLGQLARSTAKAVAPILGALNDSDAEVRAQAARALGDARITEATAPLIERLRDKSLRVRYLAAQSLGKLKQSNAAGPLIELVRTNNDEDLVVRHAAAFALSQLADEHILMERSADPSAAVRLGVLLALRHQRSPAIGRFLADADPNLVLEAARAIYDLPIPLALPALAEAVDRNYHADEAAQDALWRRVLNANYREGRDENVMALTRFIARTDVSEASRLEAVALLASWSRPTHRDRVLGHWQSLPPRHEAAVKAAMPAILAKLRSTSDVVQRRTAELAAKLGVVEVGPLLTAWIKDSSLSPRESGDALLALEQLGHIDLDRAVAAALEDRRPAVRAVGQQILARRNPTQALPLFGRLLAEGSIAEQKAVIVALGKMSEPEADRLLTRAMDLMLEAKLPSEVELELLSAASERQDVTVRERLATLQGRRDGNDPLAAVRETLVGGDAQVGRQIFFEKTAVYCVRCHKVNNIGGDVGPDLSRIGRDKPRDYLLQAIVHPNAVIAKGFESVQLAMDDGRVLVGVLREENEHQLRLVTAEGQTVMVDKSNIEQRTTSKSAMPEDLANKLSKTELRDLMEFLASLTIEETKE